MLNNIYNVSNPSEILNILWDRIKSYSDDFSKLLLFLPSRRAIRSFEMLIVKNIGHAVVLPNMVPLGTGVDNEEETDVLSNQERVIKLASILTSVPYIKTISAALPLAHDFVAMQDYLENEGIDIKTIDWDEVFNMNDSTDTATQNTKKAKAELLKIMTNFLDGISVKSVDEYTSIQDYVEKTNEDTSDINWNDVFNSAKSELLKGMTKQNMLKTQTQTRNENILLWKEKIKNYEKVIVCGSTASVPVTADLMEYIAHCDNGEIILSGKISGQKSDLERDTNPYYAEYKFLKKLGMEPTDVITLGKENKYIDFYNEAFGNTCEQTQPKPDNFTYVECNRENQEAALALQLAIDTIKSDKNKTVLIVTPDKVANQRIRTEVENYNSQQNDKDKIAVDFSAGISGNMTGLGRALLNLIDDFINDKNEPFDKLFQEYDLDLYEMLTDFVENHFDKGFKDYEIRPNISCESKDDFPIWHSIKNMSDILKGFYKDLSDVGIYLTVYDIRAFLEDAIQTVSVRYPCPKNCRISVLGTIEARMQTADVVILTGLNEDMFPALGYQSFWIPKSAAEKIGMPSQNKKVSLMALDFMTLSCAPKVYWLRTKQSDGRMNLESRFISRVRVYMDDIKSKTDLLNLVDCHDDVIYNPIVDAAVPKKIDNSDVFVTELRTLLNNPYAFYVKHILKLKPQDEYWAIPDQRHFGNIVHDIIENHLGESEEDLIKLMDEQVEDIKKEYPVLYGFWHERFVEIANYVSGLATNIKDNIMNAKIETQGSAEVEFGDGKKRTICAKADIVWPEGVMDIKTGNIPDNSAFKKGDDPQVPMEGYILQKNGFKEVESNPDVIPALQFLQLKKHREQIVSFEEGESKKLIEVCVKRVQDAFEKYSQAGVEYEYENKDGKHNKFSDCDDFARRED